MAPHRLGVLAWVLGELYFTAVLWSDAAPPVPSPADGGYLSLPPLIFVGLILLARSRIKGLPKTIWADGVTVGLAAGALSAAIVFKPVLAAVSGDSLSVATNLSYPIMDLIMLGFIAGVLAVGGWRLDRRFGVIAAGVMCFWTADTIYLIRPAEGTGRRAAPTTPAVDDRRLLRRGGLDAAARPRDPSPQRRGDQRRHRVGPPQPRDPRGRDGHRRDPPAIALASGALLCVLLRLVMTFRAHQTMLRRTTREALTDPLRGWAIAEPSPPPCAIALTMTTPSRSCSSCSTSTDSRATTTPSATRRVTPSCSAWPPARVGDRRGRRVRMGGDGSARCCPGGRTARRRCAAIEVLSDHGDGFPTKASLGSVRLPEETTNVEEALRLADQRMYAHKSQGRRAAAAFEVKHALLSALAHRDPELSDHVDDVAELAAGVAVSLGCDPAQVETIRIAAELHDIGKIAIPEAILDKPGPLTGEEWTLMRQHTIAGERIILASPALADVAPLVRSSHERWDGAGYPDQLAAESIPSGHESSPCVTPTTR